MNKGLRGMHGWRNVGLAAVCGVAMLGVTTDVLAQRMMNADPQAHHEKMAQMLELDEAQKVKFDALHQRMMPKMMAQRGQNMNAQQRFMALDPASPTYTKELEALAAQSGEAARNRILLRGEMRREMSQILRPDQQEKWQQMMRENMGKSGMMAGGKMGMNKPAADGATPRDPKDKPGRRFFYD